MDGSEPNIVAKEEMLFTLPYENVINRVPFNIGMINTFRKERTEQYLLTVTFFVPIIILKIFSLNRIN